MVIWEYEQKKIMQQKGEEEFTRIFVASCIYWHHQ